MIKDSGNRTEFDSGAVRDMQEGKGDFSLLPVNVMLNVFARDYAQDNDRDTEFMRALDALSDFQKNGDKVRLYEAVARFAAAREWSFTDMMLEVSVHFTEGAKKYGRLNWQKGIPISSYFSSAVRHLLKWHRGDDDERHDRAFVWNVMCAIWTIDNKPECNDMKEEQS